MYVSLPGSPWNLHVVLTWTQLLSDPRMKIVRILPRTAILGQNADPTGPENLLTSPVVLTLLQIVGTWGLGRLDF